MNSLMPFGIEYVHSDFIDFIFRGSLNIDEQSNGPF